MKRLINFFKDEEGATVPEYALMVALIAVAVVGTVTAIGGAANGLFGAVSDALTAATPE